MITSTGRMGLVVGLLVVAGCFTGCASNDDPLADLNDRNITARIESLDVLQGQQYLETLEWLAMVVGTPAVPHMLKALDEHESARVRAGCAQALGRAQDPQAIPGLLVSSRRDDNAGVRFTSAYALCRFRDHRGLPVLFQALNSEDPSHRREGNLRLIELTGLDFGYQHLASPAIRKAAASRWERWYEEKGPEGAAASLLPTGR
ncbi:MAG: HEAT repeat domain-containing protein [Planctomycetota bacterium]